MLRFALRLRRAAAHDPSGGNWWREAPREAGWKEREEEAAMVMVAMLCCISYIPGSFFVKVYALFISAADLDESCFTSQGPKLTFDIWNVRTLVQFSYSGGSKECKVRWREGHAWGGSMDFILLDFNTVSGSATGTCQRQFLILDHFQNLVHRNYCLSLNNPLLFYVKLEKEDYLNFYLQKITCQHFGE